MASPAPPLGPNLSSHGVNVPNFCKEFNKATENIFPGTPLSTKVWANPDRSFTMDIMTPRTTWFILRAAGVRRGSMKSSHEDDQVGMITLKHVYEIAKIKVQDSTMRDLEMWYICRMIIKQAKRMGVRVVRHIDPDEYRRFLLARRDVVAAQLKECEAQKAAKALRPAA